MKIVFLDAATTNKGDLDWSLFSALGDVERHELTKPEETAERIADAHVVVTNKVKLFREHFESAKQLQLVAVLATGYDIIDLAAARDHDVVVCNVPAYSTSSVVQTTFALLLELTHAVGMHSAAVHNGGWSSSPTFSFWKQPLVELAEKIFLVVGYGTIGQAVAQVASAFGMQVQVASLRETNHTDIPFPSVSLQEGLAQADIVSLHCPLTTDTHQIVDVRWIDQMKPTAYLLNTARGGLIHEDDLSRALVADKIAGYAADVLSSEPPSPDNPLLSAPRCILTPHLAWASLEARKRLWEMCAANVTAFLQGNPQNVV